MNNDVQSAGLALGISIFSGLAVFVQGKREGRNTGFFDLFTELINAVVAGAMAFCLGTYEGWNQYLVFLLVLASSNNATEVREKCREQIKAFEPAKILEIFKMGSGKK